MADPKDLKVSGYSCLYESPIEVYRFAQDPPAKEVTKPTTPVANSSESHFEIAMNDYRDMMSGKPTNS